MSLKDFSNSTVSGSGGSMPPNMMPPTQPDTSIEDILINYNEKFKNQAPLQHRDDLIKQSLSILIGKTKSNALLVGAAGVGKTAIVEELARRIESNDPLVPNALKNTTIYELPISNLVAGKSFVGELEETVHELLDYFEDKNEKKILFIDEIHQLLEGESQYKKIAQILKPAMARNTISIIGATTLQETKNLDKDPAFNRRFSKILVDELSKEATADILKHLTPNYTKHYNYKVSIDEDVLNQIPTIADRYLPKTSHRPDNALTLLDRSMADALIERKVMENAAKNDPVLLQAIQACPTVQLQEKAVKKTAIKLASGNTSPDEIDKEALEISLQSIQGQDDIINDLIKILIRHDKFKDLRDEDDTQPLTLLFAGKSGVGKTEITKLIAKILTGSKPITLNMNEFASPASINRIIGSPAGYVGSDSNKELPFDKLETNPYQIILLDEFEKCAKEVQGLFMTAFDEGYMETNQGKTIDFSKTIIIATTNAAETDRRSNPIGFGAEDTKDNKELLKGLNEYFDITILNRFKHIFRFKAISKDIYRQILKTRYESERERIIDLKPKLSYLPETLPDDVLNSMVDKTYVEDAGARPAKAAVVQWIEEQI